MAKDYSKYKVKEPAAYDAYPLSVPEGEVSDISRKLRAEMLAEPPGTKPKRAVWIVHGMGQQVRFATLEQLAEGISMAAAARQNPRVTVSEPEFREVQVGKTVLQRVELTFSLENNGQKQVDLYECYWAPKTEGAVKLTDVIGFLWDGGSRGLVNFFTGFQRALFGTMVPYSLRWRTPVYLLVTLAVLGALMAINAIILATGSTISGIGKLPDPSLVTPLTVIAGLVSAAAITFGVVIFLAQISKPAHSKSRWGRAIRNMTWLSIVFTILAVLAGAILMALIFWAKCVPAWLTEDTARHLQGLANLLIFSSLLLALAARTWRRRQISHTERPEHGWVSQVLFYLAVGVHLAVLVGAVLVAGIAFEGGSFKISWVSEISNWLGASMTKVMGCLLGSSWGARVYQCLATVVTSIAWVWPFLVLISTVVRKLMVEYVGDVTAYVTSNKVDRFDELRTKIKAIAKESLSAVYSAKPKTSKQFEYEKVAIVGHSLGSVIAYDTLNRLIADDKLANMPADVVGRTRMLLTFGSPLDKTAFFFSVMGKDTSHIREQMAAVVQPLIEDPECREHIPWVNVFSRNDIISGSLDFYHFPQDAPAGVPQVKKVVNVKDEDALVPLVAHVEYWSNLTVWKELLERVLDL